MNITEAAARLGLERALCLERLARVGGGYRPQSARDPLEPRQLLALAVITELRAWNRPFPRIIEALAALDWPTVEPILTELVLEEREAGFRWLPFSAVEGKHVQELAPGSDWVAYYSIGPRYAELTRPAAAHTGCGAGHEEVANVRP
jgi:hypothetical protein